MGDNDVEIGAGIFCKVIIVCVLSVRYRSYGPYYKMAGTPSSPTRFFTRVGIKNRVGDNGGPAILQCRSSDLYLMDRKENMAIYPHSSPHLQIRPCLVHPYLPQPHCWAIKKGSLWNNLAWWPLPAAGTDHPHASAQSDHQLSPPRSTPPCLISHLSFFRWHSRDTSFLIKFLRYH